MKILLLLDKYIPLPQANGVCANHIIDAIADAQVNVVCKVDNPQEPAYIKGSSGNIYPIYAPAEARFSQLSIVGKLWYVCRHIFVSLFGPVFDPKVAAAYYEKSCQIIEREVPDLIMAVLNPMEAVEALHRLKSRYPDIKMMIYDLDTASKCGKGKIKERLKAVYQKKIVAWEQKVFRAADLVVHLTQFREHFSQDKYVEFSPKTLYQDIPLLEPKEQIDGDGKADGLSFIYSGSFYPGLREPGLITQIMDIVLGKSESTLSVYTKGLAYESLCEKYKGQKCVVVSEYIPEDVLNEVIKRTGFLLSLGNKESEMFPSKIVTYVAALKPIIHIYQSENDPVNEYLEDYPDRLLLNVEDGAECNAERILEFIYGQRPQIRKDLIETLYCRNSGAYNAEMILQYFSEQEEKC